MTYHILEITLQLFRVVETAESDNCADWQNFARTARIFVKI